LWAPTYNLTLSTICQPSSSGYFIMPPSQPWGLVSLDWSVAKSIWSKNGLHNGTIEATSREGCRMIKAASPNTKCFLYHNMELALESIESQRAVMYDATKAGYFLQFTDGAGHANGTIYNERQEPGDQYFWNFSSPDASDYYISSVLASIAYPETDGSFTDDVTGLPAEHGAAPGNMKLSAADVQRLQFDTSVANGRLIDQAVAAGKYIWAAFGDSDGVSAGPTASTCATWMHERCNDAWQARATTQAFDKAAVNQSIASFLIVRPPIGFIGFGWESDMRDWRAEFLWQVGEPQGACAELSPTLFTRAWTYGNATLDCATFTATVPTAN
jgi:hypothetical protein